MKLITIPVTLSVAALLAGCPKPFEKPVPPPKADSPTREQPAGIDWKHSKEPGAVEAAFAQAKADNRPLFLYWGAAWCPPCNQIKSTIFVRPDFVEKSRSFVPVYLDGDTPSAQRYGKQFRISGYPTTILFRPDGSEITRLAGEVDAAKYIQLLGLGLARHTGAAEALKLALKGPAASSEDWRLLAYYAWETDEQTLVPKTEVAAVLKTLAASCPPAQQEAAARLQLKAIAAAATAEKGDMPGVDRATAAQQFNGLLAAPGLTRAQADVFIWQSDDIVKYLTAANSVPRTRLIERLSAALDTLAADATLSNNDRIGAVLAKVQLARLDNEKGALPVPLVAQARAEAARADREVTDANERQSVINSAGYLLRQAGLLDESDALYKAELPRSHSAYYYMSGLASNARKRGDKAAAIDWAQQAYDGARGPATRLQWGGNLVRYLTELAPEQEARIEAAATRWLSEFAEAPDLFAGRNRSVLTRASEHLVKWNTDAKGKHAALLAQLRAKLAPACGKLAEDAEQSACTGLFKS